MRPVILQRWIEFTEALEGGVACFYNDIRGLTTIAYGDLCNTPGEAAALPLVHSDGTFATTSEKIAAWMTVHNDPGAAAGGWRYAARLTPLRLTPDGMAGLALRKLEGNDADLRRRFADWEDYCACAQMALHSLAWACGSRFYFPKLVSAVQARDWDAASVHIQMNEFTPEGKRNAGLVPRNTRNRVLMLNAQRIEAYHLDPDTLEWDVILGVSDTPTLPDLGKLVEEWDHTPVTREESTASQPTRAPAAADYLGSDPDDDAA